MLPSDVITIAAGLMNDFSQSQYTNAVCLPYFNLALDELQELFELNDIPVTNETSAVINVPSGATRIGPDIQPLYPLMFLPSDLIEIQQLWESQTGLNRWTPMDKKDFLPHYLEVTQISNLQIWAWMGGSINVIAANANVDLKIDYIARIFNTPIPLARVDENLPFTNVKTYLEYKTAALCAMFVAENESRAMALDSLCGTALSRALGIPVKGMQSIVTRRRPFRASYKRRGVTR
jgi:hypothetical protein